MITKITVSKIDQGTLEEIKKAHTALKSSTDEVKELHIYVDSATGDIESALESAQILHSDASVIPVTNASGKLGVGATIVVASGVEGRRTSDPKSTFILNDGGKYGSDSKPEDLEGPDFAVFDAMSSLTGKRNTILKKIIESSEFSVKIAKKCGIIDKINGFESAFKPKKPVIRKGKKKSAVSVEVVESTGETENETNEKAGPIVQTITQKKNTTETKTTSEGVQRGRIK